jgi:hypothetical protein
MSALLLLAQAKLLSEVFLQVKKIDSRIIFARRSPPLFRFGLIVSPKLFSLFLYTPLTDLVVALIVGITAKNKFIGAICLQQWPGRK